MTDTKTEKTKTREEIEDDIVQDLIEYIDGDVENGPRHGVEWPSQAQIEAEIDRRMAMPFEYEETTR